MRMNPAERNAYARILHGIRPNPAARMPGRREARRAKPGPRAADDVRSELKPSRQGVPAWSWLLAGAMALTAAWALLRRRPA